MMRAPTVTPTPTPILTPELDEVVLCEAVVFVEVDVVEGTEDVVVVELKDVIYGLVFVSVTLDTLVTTALMTNVKLVSLQQSPLLSLSQQYVPDPSADF